MGPVSKYLVNQIAAQVDQHGIVVWYDPGEEYRDVADGLDLSGVRVHRHQDSFFATRRAVEELLGGQSAEPLVIYVSGDRSDCFNALLELEAAGVVMMPGQQPPTRNTRLGVVARAALSEILAADHVDEIVRQVEDGTLSLAEVDSLGSGGGGDSAVIRVVFETTDAARVLLAVLTDIEVADVIAKKDALGEVTTFVANAVGLSTRRIDGFDGLRQRLARHVFACDLATRLPEDVQLPSKFPSIPQRKEQRSVAIEVAGTWRKRRDLQASYVAAVTEAQKSLKVDLSAVPREALWEIETTLEAEDALLDSLEEAALEAPTVELLEAATGGISRFWAIASPPHLERWLLLAAALRVLVMAQQVRDELERKGADAEQLAASYLHGSSDDREPWSALDTAYRHLEARVRRSDVLGVARAHDRLERLVAGARAAYGETMRLVAEHLSSCFASGGIAVSLAVPQRQVFQRFVEPALGQGTTALVMVDGLRFEMGRELAAALGEEIEVELHPCQAQLPSVTHVGMAALLPFAHQEFELTSGGDRGAGVRVRGSDVRSRASRITYLADTLGQYGVEELKLDQLIPPSKRTRERVAGADLVVVTATEELDGLCESGNAAMAHRLMDDVLVQLRRAVRNLFDLGVETVVIAADHGFLLGEELAEGDKIDPPGGTTIELHRRVWVGTGGAAAPSYLRLSAKELGVEGDLEIAVPTGLGCFKVKGGQTAYFHGGASPQELFVPVLVARAAAPSGVVSAQIRWEMALGSRTISSPFVSVHVTGEADSLFEVQPPRVRVEVREGRDLISRIVSATYGYDESTGDAVLEMSDDGRTIQPNTVMVQLDPMPTGESVTVHLVDADSEERLASLQKVPVSRGGFE